MKITYLLLLTFFLASSCNSCESSKRKSLISSSPNAQNEEGEIVPNIENSTAPGSISEILTYKKGEETSFEYKEPTPHDFVWKWVLCTESGIPSSTVTSNLPTKGKSFISPWYDPINVYIKNNAVGTIGTQSEAIYFIDAHYDSNGRYNKKEFSTNTETPCGVWGNLGFPDQVIIKMGTETKPLDMEILKVNNDFYILKSKSALTGLPIEVWLWKRRI